MIIAVTGSVDRRGNERKESSMDLKRIGLGVAVWTVGLLVPTAAHIMLINAAIQESGHNYSYHSMVKYFWDIPALFWVYLVLMTVVGGVLVLSGMKPCHGGRGKAGGQEGQRG